MVVILFQERIPGNGAHSVLRIYPTQTNNFPTAFKKAVFKRSFSLAKGLKVVVRDVTASICFITAESSKARWENLAA